jgi:hypothetical protein
MTMTNVSLSLFIMLSLVPVQPAAAPGAATLIAPSGSVVGSTIAFTWQSVPQSTAYLVSIFGPLTSGASPLRVWYTAEQAGCANSQTCTITLTPPVTAGTYSWRVQAWAAGEPGPLSALNKFVMKDPVQNWGGKVQDSARFGDALAKTAYLDNETGLVWERAPRTDTYAWAAAMILCGDRNVGGRKGFRLPTREELLTLVDPTHADPSLPAGHPFNLGGIPNLMFWTQTDHPSNADAAMLVDFSGGVSKALQKSFTTPRHWCVRGPGAHAQ